MHIPYEEIDPGIAEIVSLLQEHGVDTFASCEGGDNHAFNMPTVRANIKHMGNAEMEANEIADILLGGGYSGFYVSIYRAYPSRFLKTNETVSFIEVSFWVSPVVKA